MSTVKFAMTILSAAYRQLGVKLSLRQDLWQQYNVVADSTRPGQFRAPATLPRRAETLTIFCSMPFPTRRLSFGVHAANAWRLQSNSPGWISSEPAGPRVFNSCTTPNDGFQSLAWFGVTSVKSKLGNLSNAVSGLAPAAATDVTIQLNDLVRRCPRLLSRTSSIERKYNTANHRVIPLVSLRESAGCNPPLRTITGAITCRQ